MYNIYALNYFFLVLFCFFFCALLCFVLFFGWVGGRKKRHDIVFEQDEGNMSKINKSQLDKNLQLAIK